MKNKKFEPDFTLSCKDCKQALAEIWITKPDDELPWRVKATCPFCNSISGEARFAGMFGAAPVAKRNGPLIDDESLVTVIDNQTIDTEGTVILHMIKA